MIFLSNLQRPKNTKRWILKKNYTYFCQVELAYKSKVKPSMCIYESLFTNSLESSSELYIVLKRGAFTKCVSSSWLSKGRIPTLDANSALLFCYFNNLEYFYQYLEAYQGQIVILIGPVDGLRHCEPEPHFLGQKHSDTWTLLEKHNIRNAFEDLVCIYKRK